MYVRTYAAAVHGVDARLITVEVNAGGTVASGKQFYFMVGLPDAAVKEGFHRIESAIKNSGFRLPRLKLVVNLAPANLRKEGSSYDLTIAIGILASTGQIPADSLSDFLIIGELSLDGKLRPVRGILPITLEARRSSFRGIIVPIQNANEAALVRNFPVYAVESLHEAIQLLSGKISIRPTNTPDIYDPSSYQLSSGIPDFIHVKGQEKTKRAIEVAAAGGHNILLMGPPGSGKTMIAKRLPGILPKLSLDQALDVTKVYSISGMLSSSKSLMSERPFRAPHHSISHVALVGGGSVPMPGEISLAHHGVLFLDELPEFNRNVLEVLRQPLEDRKVTISRARMSVEYPANFMLVASMNPCPCGFYNHPTKECICAPGVVTRYLNKISGPLMDRIDLHIEVHPVSYEELNVNHGSRIGSSEIRERVVKARELQVNRYSGSPVSCNAEMTLDQIKKFGTLNQNAAKILKTAMTRLSLSARAYHRIIKVSRTIADLSEQEEILQCHVAEAIQYRSLDRQNWPNQ
jgi:magnesium chelatase family protein